MAAQPSFPVRAPRACVSLDLGGITEHRNQILNILKPMMADFKGAISEFRTEGASQADIDAMLDEFEEAYASDAEGKLVIAVLREAAQPPHANH
jgi:hypothetical protein